jgi:predicted RNase H-like HicB family nuclease
VRNRYRPVLQPDGKQSIASCPEVSEANGQGKTREEALESLVAAIELVLDYRVRRDSFRASSVAEPMRTEHRRTYHRKIGAKVL